MVKEFSRAANGALWLRSGGSIGDTEQTLSSFYEIADYPDTLPKRSAIVESTSSLYYQIH